MWTSMVVLSTQMHNTKTMIKSKFAQKQMERYGLDELFMTSTILKL